MAFETVLEGALTGAGYTFWTNPAGGTRGADLLGVWWMLALTAIARAAAMTALRHWGGWRSARA